MRRVVQCRRLAPPRLSRNLLAENVAQDLLPSKSKKYYEAAYEKFVQWKQNIKAISTSENCLLVYLNGMAKKFKPGFSSSFPNLEKTFTSKYF